jgi:hypothetical protein
MLHSHRRNSQGEEHEDYAAGRDTQISYIYMLGHHSAAVSICAVNMQISENTLSTLVRFEDYHITKALWNKIALAAFYDAAAAYQFNNGHPSSK